MINLKFQNIPITKKSITFPIKKLHGQYCLTPFNSAHINTRGDVNMCLCPSWQPTIVGNIFENSIDEILSTPLAQDIRKSIIDGTYQYCNEKVCPLLTNSGQLNTLDSVPPNIQHQLQDSTRYDMPYEISLHGDATCNLSCPSCRTSVIRISEDQHAAQEQIASIVHQNIFSRPTDNKINLLTSGAGEVFASPMLMSFLNKISIADFPNLKLNLHTNGLLVKKNWYQLLHLESAISHITVSIDAASPTTYELIRRGGKWQQLQTNLSFILQKKEELGFELRARMIVQKNNFLEILEFYKMCQQLGVTRTEYSRLTNWKTMELSMQEHDVFNSLHPCYSQALDLINQVKQLPNTFFEGEFL
jgi:MoaA/NifB/PqqE/SkfB family radical SAM enzyme